MAEAIGHVDSVPEDLPAVTGARMLSSPSTRMLGTELAATLQSLDPKRPAQIH